MGTRVGLRALVCDKEFFVLKFIFCEVRCGFSRK